MKTSDIKELTRDQLIVWLEERKIRPFRAIQIFKWIYLRNADSFEMMTDLGKEIRDLLLDNFTINRLDITKKLESNDGTKKYLFKLEDGKFVESVLIREKSHFTLCISSQVGCAQGCSFCLTAKGGFSRNLTTGEIISQIRDIQKDMDESDNLSNLVLMGMGEPLANYDNLVNALNIITDTDFGLKFSTRRVTLSTAGFVPKFADLGKDTKVNLAVSLNATDNKTRSMLMPINRKYPLEELLEACRLYPLKPRRKITFEYILIKGINDSPEDAERLAKLLTPIKAKINLIPFNEHSKSDLKSPESSVVLKFQKDLNKYGYSAIIRYSKGQDISAACGQLGLG
jgi:23S rRNA (adenine2503-C2)-methyltransferase